MDTPNSKSTSTKSTDCSNESDKDSKLINSCSSDSPIVQDSPVFNFISNLSPIPPVKVTHVAQGFPGLASPPLVFKSPATSLTSLINRKLRSCSSNSDLQDTDKCQNYNRDVGDSAKLDIVLWSPANSSDKKGRGTQQAVNCSPSGFFDELLADPAECEGPLRKTQVDVVPQVGCLEKKDDVIHENVVPNDSTSLKVTGSLQAKSRISVKLLKNDSPHLISASSQSSGVRTKLPTGHTSDLCQIGDFSEAGHLERGSLRRCLFDGNQRKYSADGSGTRNSTENLNSFPEVANMSPPGTSGNSQINNFPEPATSMCVSPITGNSSATISKPLGIGLHLNSVVYPRSIDSAVSGQQSSQNVVRVKGDNPVLVGSNQSAGNVNTSAMPSNLMEVPPNSKEIHPDIACSVADSGIPLASDVVEQFQDLIVLKADNPSPVVHEKRTFNSELAENGEDFNLGSPKKKRKKSSPDDDTSKRCNCKKTKCLKLYCDCFAAGFYCAEGCACQGCSNRPEYEDTVLETRQQIESRNPLAFAPKVVPLVADSPASSKEVGNLSTPASARHKRGCNCKKSMCLKKYCECYQSGVGCSDGCRCEGCKNVYGKKEDHSIARELIMKKFSEAAPEGILDEKQNTSIVSSNVVNPRLHNSPSVTPITPALQCSDQRKNALKSRLPFRRFLQTLESDENFSTFRNSPSHSMPLEPVDASCENSGDRLVSTIPTFSKTRDLSIISHPQFPPPSSHLRWRNSPITPITESAGPVLLGKHSEMLGDDTPEILKDSANPNDSVKVRSPNKKRISPPHSRTDSPESLTNSRKFVLQSVCGGRLDRHTLPRFPPLSPYSKNSGIGNINDSSDP